MSDRGGRVRRMGFIRDQEGIMNRYLRESDNWGPHLDHTRTFINQSFIKTAPETVAILGSGWLLDVPLDELRKRFRKIFLADIRHPPQIRKKVARMPEVDLIEADLTGGAVEQVWQSYRRGKHPDLHALLERLTFTPPLVKESPGAIISVNLLNQLDILICDYLNRQGHFQQSELLPVRAWLQEHHITWISSFPGCIITDTTEICLDSAGREDRKSLIYCDLPEGFRHESWEWEFDAQGTYHRGSRTRMVVRAVEWA
ncbi:MAG: hypothetical protein ACWGNV_01075 [Bacteroidales bacterium]